MSKHIILIGYRAVGKSSVAQVLGEKLQRPVISTDQEIEKKVGKIKEYVTAYGWEKFREIECDVLEEIATSKKVNAIIDTGGGIIEDEENRKLLRDMGTVYWLKTSPATIHKRLEKDTERLALTNKKTATDEIEEMLRKREPLYQRAADYTLDAEDKTATEVAQQIILHITMKTKLIVSIAESNHEALQEAINNVPQYVDLIEIRIDALSRPNSLLLKKIITESKRSFLLTNRSKGQGGFHHQNEKERTRLLKELWAIKPDYLDLEMDLDKNIIQEFVKKRSQNGKTKIILSHHIGERTPPLRELEEIYQKMRSFAPDIIKIVTRAQRILDNATIETFLKGKQESNNKQKSRKKQTKQTSNREQKVIAFCMGMEGQLSRILAPKYGSWATYGFLEGAKETADGQLSVEELETVFYLSKINSNTDVYGVLGEHAENSMSKYIHNKAFRSNGLNKVYVPFKVKTKELEAFMAYYRGHISGGSVTTPHKETVIQHLDEIDPLTQAIGAVNTISTITTTFTKLDQERRLCGTNTDWYGAIAALKEQTPLRGKKVLLIGTGGAAKAILYGLLKEGAVVTVCNRTLKTAKKTVESIVGSITATMTIKKAVRTASLHELKSGQLLLKDHNIIINATSVGMTPNHNASVIPEGLLTGREIVMDIIYSPLETKLIKQAKDAGCMVITGDRMLLHQAIGQFRLWTGKELNREEGEAAIQEAFTPFTQR